MAYSNRVRSALRAGWQLIPSEFTPVAGATFGRCWRISAADERYLVSLIPGGDRIRCEAGLSAIEYLHARGIAVGPPRRAAGGAVVTLGPDGMLCVLEDVPGRPLDPADPLDQQWWGDLLGRLHRELADFDHRGLLGWHWIRPDAAHLELEPWLRPAVADAVAAVTKLTVTDQLRYGVLHGDPVAAAFRMNVATGRTGLVGWGPAATGPLLYDLAAAVIDAGGPAAATELIDGYAAAGPVARDEIEVALPVLLRFCWAARADWCARRLAAAQVPVGSAGSPPGKADQLTADRAALMAAQEALTPT